MNLVIDYQAYYNKLRKIHPGEKMLFSLATMLVVLLFFKPVLGFLVVVLMSGVTVLLAGIPIKNYLSLLLIPLSFLFLSVFALVIVISSQSQDFLWAIKVGGYWLGINNESIIRGGQLVLQALALICCMYFLILTTPMVDILEMLKKMKVPVLVTELISLIYRFIFILLEEMKKITMAQQARLGYSNLKNFYNSAGQLASRLLVKGFQRTQQMNHSLLARCYQGELRVLELNYNFSKKNIVLVIVVEIILVLIGIS